jgi:DNA end-binding protein Ku
MAARATWKGYLKVSLVNIPIKVFPATESSATISFNQLHAECQTRIQQKVVPHCEREAEQRARKGLSSRRAASCSRRKTENVRTGPTRIIDLVQFADESSIDPMYVDRTYYLALTEASRLTRSR